MQTSTARLTIGTVLGAVTTSAVAVSSLFDATAKGIGMLDTLVSSSSLRLKKTTAVNMSLFDQKLTEDTAKSIALRKHEVDNFKSSFDNAEQYYDEAYNEIKAVIDAIKD